MTREGSGSLLINIGRSVAKHVDDSDNIKYYAQELKQNTYNLTRMNLVMRGILPSNITTRNGDTLEEDWPYFEDNDPIGTYNPLYVDAVVSNPPYSQNWDPEGKENDPRYSRYGVAPRGKADYAFLLHDLFHIKPDGIMTIVLPHGVLFRGGEEGTIRKNLIEYNHIDAVIGLPANIFFGTGIPTIIMVLRKKRPNTDILIIDASKGFIKVGKNNKLQASDIRRIADTMASRESIPKFSRLVSRDEVRENDYNLNIPRYVDSSDEAESWDIYASMFGGIPQSEIAGLDSYWEIFPNLKKDLFIENSNGYMQVKDGNLEDLIKSHHDVESFKNDYVKRFHGFDSLLHEQLIDKMSTVSISRGETILSKEIFNRLEGVELIDEYEAYQILSDGWIDISADLEMIQTEGVEVIKQVDPNIVTRKKNGKDVDVQDGWFGKIIPFELIEEKILFNEASSLKDKEDKLAQVISEQEEIFESLTEEDKADLTDILNEDDTAFLTSELNKMSKALLKGSNVDDYPEDSQEYKVVTMAAKLDEERQLKRLIKDESSKLHALVKTTINNLSDEEAENLLKEKWISPLVEKLELLPVKILDNLIAKIQALANKYETTLSDLENEIKETEAALIDMIDQLVGSEADMLGLAELKKLLGGE